MHGIQQILMNMHGHYTIFFKGRQGEIFFYSVWYILFDLATWCKELTHRKRPWCSERVNAGGEGMTEDEMVGRHHQLNGHEFEQALGIGNGQGGLACCSPWGRKELDTTERLNWTDSIYSAFLLFFYLWNKLNLIHTLVMHIRQDPGRRKEAQWPKRTTLADCLLRFGRVKRTYRGWWGTLRLTAAGSNNCLLLGGQMHAIRFRSLLKSAVVEESLPTGVRPDEMRWGRQKGHRYCGCPFPSSSVLHGWVSFYTIWFSSVQFSHSVMSDSLWLHES